MELRKQYDARLQELTRLVAEMGEASARAAEDAMKALMTNNVEEAKQLQQRDMEINTLQRKVEALCMELLLRQQPVAGDLRRVSAALKLVTDVERMGDEAKNIAECVPYLGAAGAAGRLPAQLEQMAVDAVAMCRSAVSAYVGGDLNLAEKVKADDDDVDDAFLDIKKELSESLAKNATEEIADEALDTLMIARFLERLGDHAVNVAEWATYAVTGLSKNGRIV